MTSHCTVAVSCSAAAAGAATVLPGWLLSWSCSSGLPGGRLAAAAAVADGAGSYCSTAAKLRAAALQLPRAAVGSL
ncbi:g2599 [Coccomyxa elongata]